MIQANAYYNIINVKLKQKNGRGGGSTVFSAKQLSILYISSLTLLLLNSYEPGHSTDYLDRIIYFTALMRNRGISCNSCAVQWSRIHVCCLAAHVLLGHISRLSDIWFRCIPWQQILVFLGTRRSAEYHARFPKSQTLWMQKCRAWAWAWKIEPYPEKFYLETIIIACVIRFQD